MGQCHWVRALALCGLLVASIVVVPRPSDADATAYAAAQPSVRDPQLWPFPWNSIWNMPIGSGAQYVDAEIEPGRDFGVFADEDILILAPNAPLVDVLEHDADWDPARARCTSIVSPPQVHIPSVPVPASFTTEVNNPGTPNASAAILMPNGETVVQTQPLHVCGPGGPVASQYRFPNANIRTSNGRAGAHGGSSMSSIGGTIRLGELVPGGVIRHALKLVIDSSQYTYYDAADTTPGYRWPAFSADFGAQTDYGGSVPEVEMGSLLALRPSFSVQSLRTEPARILARAMIDYGGYVVDSSGWDTHYFVTEFGTNGRVIDEFAAQWGWDFITPQTSTCGNAADSACAWSMDMADLFSNLHAVANNTSSNIGSPGTRRTACAPPFADGTGGAPASCSAPPAKCKGETATIDMNQPGVTGMGTPGNDVIVGTPGADIIDGLGGHDRICSFGGDDVIDTGPGGSIVWAGNGDDIIEGGDGVDFLVGQNGDDVIRGRAGNDLLYGNNGDDELRGGDGHDYISGRDGEDLMYGGDGTDVMNGGGKSDTMFGDRGNDTLKGNQFADQMYGGRGNDTLTGGDGGDHLRGETGNDVLDGSRGDDILWGGSGTDSCDGRTGVDTSVSCENEANIP